MKHLGCYFGIHEWDIWYYHNPIDGLKTRGRRCKRRRCLKLQQHIEKRKWVNR